MWLTGWSCDPVVELVDVRASVFIMCKCRNVERNAALKQLFRLEEISDYVLLRCQHVTGLCLYFRLASLQHCVCVCVSDHLHFRQVTHQIITVRVNNHTRVCVCDYLHQLVENFHQLSDCNTASYASLLVLLSFLYCTSNFLTSAFICIAGLCKYFIGGIIWFQQLWVVFV